MVYFSSNFAKFDTESESVRTTPAASSWVTNSLHDAGESGQRVELRKKGSTMPIILVFSISRSCMR